MKKGRCGTHTHDDPRHGTITLFAAMALAEGRLIGSCMPRHCHQEWITFLTLIDEQTPAELDLPLLIDHDATHKHPAAQRWLTRHPRGHRHFLPTSRSWLHLIERWFRELTDTRLRRGTFHSETHLIQAIMDYMAEHKKNPRSFSWTAKADTILDKVGRARVALDKLASE